LVASSPTTNTSSMNVGANVNSTARYSIWMLRVPAQQQQVAGAGRSDPMHVVGSGGIGMLGIHNMGRDKQT
jgi:hypothetical protein